LPIFCGLRASELRGLRWEDINFDDREISIKRRADAKNRIGKLNSKGAKQMIMEGAFQDPKPDAVFGLHVTSGLASGRIGHRAGVAMASADELPIKVTGRQGHAGYPSKTVDPVTTPAQVVLGVQTIVSRRTDLMKAPTVVSITTINGGSRFNIVHETDEMTGTIRTYDAQERSGVQLLGLYHVARPSRIRQPSILYTRAIWQSGYAYPIATFSSAAK
jgi:acetylornithine deacetylase/succinyl-diaminopimelate desuccinylase-like protein